MQKFAKVNHYYLLIFEGKELNSILKDQKLAKFYNKYFSIFFSERNVKILALNGKNLNGWSHKLETFHVETLGTILK